MSVALASEHPERFAGIAAYGWMVDMRNTENGIGNQGIPFQVIQGDNEFVEQNDQGEMVVMPDEQRAIRSLFLYNQMISEQVLPDYGTTPYWGYAPDNMKQEQVRNRNWTINDYHREGFDNPFAQLIMIEEAGHILHRESADYSWAFLQHFLRDEVGIVHEN